MSSYNVLAIVVGLVLIAIIVVVGAIWSPDNLIQIVGFCTLIATAFVGILQRNTLAAKQSEELNKQTDELKTSIKENPSGQDSKNLPAGGKNTGGH